MTLALNCVSQHKHCHLSKQEDPWLAAAHGSVTLIHVDDALRGGRGGGGVLSQHSGNSSRRRQQQPQAAQQADAPPAVRSLPATGAALHCCELRDQFVAAGSKTGVVQTFDFTRAADAEAHSQVMIPRSRCF